MKILAERNADKRTMYQMTKGADSKGMMEAAGLTLTLDAFVIYEDESKGCVIAAIKSADGTIYGTNSVSFTKEFKDIVDIFGDELTAIKVITGKTKAGRTFVTCTIAE